MTKRSDCYYLAFILIEYLNGLIKTYLVFVGRFLLSVISMVNVALILKTALDWVDIETHIETFVGREIEILNNRKTRLSLKVVVFEFGQRV